MSLSFAESAYFGLFSYSSCCRKICSIFDVQCPFLPLPNFPISKFYLYCFRFQCSIDNSNSHLRMRFLRVFPTDGAFLIAQNFTMISFFPQSVSFIRTYKYTRTHKQPLLRLLPKRIVIHRSVYTPKILVYCSFKLTMHAVVKLMNDKDKTMNN